ncbi:unnamed protein product (macronuclear) [Paramecium tetraurelia]|uniref:Uncharacterized protein n=1 Tax=Paramecium tetraurelia TaxID=5888 RepID=A0EIR8_PARTE|nr:uncharacterized protein GSPATT00027538001 [Paramecium tetraurelia]CAK95209.1 unnamed protein product [Paramecium tetraurelia]|eukprot:XP_001462582.1 hypothetical protein (macronuclear) [Paramecium tetraurelia strain d4-2]
MKFEVEDNLQSIIDELDQDLQLKAKLIDFQQIFSLIKEQINKDHEKIDCLSIQIERLQYNLNENIKQREQESHQYQQQIIIKSEELAKQKANYKKEKAVFDDQVKQFKYQNAIQIQELEELRKQINQEQETNYKLSQNLRKTKELEQMLKDQQQHYETTISKLRVQLETDNQVFKNELEQQEIRIESKYRQLIQEHKQLTQQISELKQSYNQMKQQKESVEKTLDQNNQKIKELKSGVIQDKQTMSKSEKAMEELQKQLVYFKNKVIIDEKREGILKQKAQQDEDLISELLQIKEDYQNLRQTLKHENQIEIDKIMMNNYKQIQGFVEQIQIQRLKYEKLLGNKISLQEVQQYQQVNFSQQYEDPVHLEYVQNLEQLSENQKLEVCNLKQQIVFINEEHSQEIEHIQKSYEQRISDLICQQQQELQQQSAEFQEFKEKVQADFNYKAQIMTQQFSFQLDQQRQEQKQLQQIIDQSKLSGDEKTKLLEIASEEILTQKQKYDHDIYEERNIQKQLRYEFENNILQLKSENQRQLDYFKRDAENLQNQIKDLIQRDQLSKQRISELFNEQKQDKSHINQLEIQLSKKQTELKKQNEVIKNLNIHISSLMMEIENAKQTYNIFASPSLKSSHHYLKKVDLDILQDSQRSSQRNLRDSQDFQTIDMKASRNKSQQAQKFHQIKQQLLPY